MDKEYRRRRMEDKEGGRGENVKGGRNERTEWKKRGGKVYVVIILLILHNPATLSHFSL